MILYIKNIKNINKFKNYENGTRIRLKPEVYKIVPDFNCGLLYNNIDTDQYEFKTNEKY